MLEILRECLERAGAYEYGVVDPRDVEYTQEVREYCEKNTCRKYGKTWACPPAIGTLDECRERAQSYENMLIFSGRYDIEDSLDFEGMTAGAKDFKEIAARLHDEVKPHLNDFLLLSNEGCGNCSDCTYPDAPCRFPDRVHGSIEGYGVYVFKLATQAGIKYNNGPNTMTYFGALLYNDPE